MYDIQELFRYVIAIHVVFMILSLAVTAFWIWMIIDCAKNELLEGHNKTVWILIVILTGWIGALIYFFVERPKKAAETAAPPPVPPSSAPQRSESTMQTTEEDPDKKYYEKYNSG